MDSESPIDPFENELAEDVQPIEVTEAVETAEVADEIEVARYDQSATTVSQATNVYPISHELPPQFQNVAAKGGAIAAIVLGCLAVFGAFVTQWSLFNAVIGLILGLWGLNSNLFRTAVTGIVLCAIGIVLCITI